jgi:hypothetical protein
MIVMERTISISAFRKKLSSYSEESILLSRHAELRCELRDISKKDIVENIRNPHRLKQFGLQDSVKRVYDCWFEYSKNLGHHYVIVLNGNVLVVTVVKIRTRWQKRVESYAKKIQR